jgi:hypothetical protein
VELELLQELTNVKMLWELFGQLTLLEFQVFKQNFAHHMIVEILLNL